MSMDHAAFHDKSKHSRACAGILPMNRAVVALFGIVASISFQASIIAGEADAAGRSQRNTAGTPANGLEKDPRVVSWHALDVQCHQLVGDRQGPRACTQRATAGTKLNQQGLCLGRKGQKESQYNWHKCKSGSLRFAKKRGTRAK